MENTFLAALDQCGSSGLAFFHHSKISTDESTSVALATKTGSSSFKCSFSPVRNSNILKQSISAAIGRSSLGFEGLNNLAYLKIMTGCLVSSPNFY